jgi:hypothetical protein
MRMPVLFPLPILIPTTAPHSSSITRGWYSRPNCGRCTKWTQSHPTPRDFKKKGKKSSISPLYKILEPRHFMPAGSIIIHASELSSLLALSVYLSALRTALRTPSQLLHVFQWEAIVVPEVQKQETLSHMLPTVQELLI